MRDEALGRAAFWLTVLLAGATVWVSPRLPLADLPQHAGQIQLWHDLVLGTSKWQSLLYVNWFTPYLVGSGLALLLSFVMPVSAALKILLALTYYAFVWACVLLRRRMGAEPRLDWLFIPGFFGLAYLYGLLPFLVALPIATAFIVLAHYYAGHRTPVLAVVLCLADAVLFFSHGLVFLFANAIAAVFLLLEARSLKSLILAAIPYAALAVLCAAYVLLQLSGGGLPQAGSVRPDWPGIMHGVDYLLFFPMGAPDKDWIYAALVPLLIAVPPVMGCRLNWRNRAALVPIGILLLWLVAVPETFADTYFVGTRFAVFFLPFYVLLFAPAPGSGTSRALAATIGAALVCLAFVAVQVQRLRAFAHEAEAFNEVLAVAEPGQRAQQLVKDWGSLAARTPMAYTSFPLWYQVEKAGLVDFNFAFYRTQVVRYRDAKAQGELPPAAYRYFFVRSRDPLPANFLQSSTCVPQLKKQSGDWMLFETVHC